MTNAVREYEENVSANIRALKEETETDEERVTRELAELEASKQEAFAVYLGADRKEGYQMSDKKKRSRKPQQTYRHKQNAVSVTIYDQHGETIPAEVRHAAENALTQLAFENNLLINIAHT